MKQMLQKNNEGLTNVPLWLRWFFEENTFTCMGGDEKLKDFKPTMENLDVDMYDTRVEGIKLLK